MSNSIIRGADRRRIQQRAEPRNSFTKARRMLFLETLAATANVKGSAAVVGISQPAIYKWRIRDPDFRAAWERALEAGYARLEEQLLARALGEVSTDYAFGEGEGEPAEGAKAPRPFDPALALNVLRLRGRAATGRQAASFHNRATVGETLRVVTHKMDMLAKRLGNTR